MSLTVLKKKEAGWFNTIHAADGKTAILKTLAYFDIFHYPLTRTEIKNYLSVQAGDIALAGWLAELEAEKLVFYFNGFYTLQDNPLLAPRRIAGNKKAEALMQKAMRIGRFLYSFPFVKAVGVSGSLSKNYADENSDIDFFIITGKNRLWISRTLMHLYKKLTFITGRQHYYCMNYYIDETALALEDRNIFTAIELKTLIPVCGRETINEFDAQNKWADSFFPACSFKNPATPEPSKSWLKRAGEWLLNNKAGNRLEEFCMKTTQKRWERKKHRGKHNEKGLAMGLISGKNFARSNPGKLQERILSAYQMKVNDIITASPGHSLSISSVK